MHSLLQRRVCILGLILAFTSAAFAQEQAQDNLPKVLIIGDSISIGYTPFVLKMLEGKAVVKHNPGNAQHTGTGLEKLDAWLGDEKWDLIHFNWGLWDLCYRNPESTNQGNRDKANGTVTYSVAEYKANLEKLVTRLEGTGAHLVWASTSVIPEGEAGRKVGDDEKYNKAAAQVMKKHKIPTDDLYGLTSKFPASLFTEPGNVHYTPEGYEKIANQVAACIEASLESATAAAP